jgi:hypothetical protein
VSALVFALFVAFFAPCAYAQPADVAAIQAREARNADARTLAALERFRAALVERYGRDPKITMLVIGETEGEALVVRADGTSEHAIRQGERWIGTEGRALKPWVSPAIAATHAFTLSSMKAETIRSWLDGWRNVPGQATDFVTGYAIGYDPARASVSIRASVGSMTTGRLSRQTFDAAK